jgi:hypothetical protein
MDHQTFMPPSTTMAKTTFGAETILKHAARMTHQQAHEIQPFGHRIGPSCDATFISRIRAGRSFAATGRFYNETAVCQAKQFSGAMRDARGSGMRSSAPAPGVTFAQAETALHAVTPASPMIGPTFGSGSRGHPVDVQDDFASESARGSVTAGSQLSSCDESSSSVSRILDEK